ncbi:MAG: hypothetical protein IJD57_07655 [Candidatus Gastranaerophilales bacterium]|nr:hypothetical protein [Candidatus Gastranaerophilales bacterium]
MQISNFISKMLELLENKETAGTTSSSAKKSNKLFSVDYSNENLKYLENSNLSYEKLQELALKEELKALSSQMTVELTKMMASGKITPEKYEEIEEVLSGGVNSENIIELQKMVSELEEPKTQETFDNAEDIEEKLGELGEKTRESVMKKVGDINSIKSLEVLDNGSFKILTTDDSSILTSESGKIIQTYDNEYKTGFDVYDEQDRLKSSTYVDHKKDDVTVVEKYEHNDDGSYKETIDSTADPKTQKIVSVDENSNITNVEIKNKETGEVTQDEEFSQTLNQNPSSDGAMVTGGASDVGGPTNDDIAADEAQLAQLQQEQTQTQQDLTCQQATYDQTNAQKEQEVGALDSQIATEQTNLDSATQEQTAAQGEVDEATGVCEQAQAGVDSAQGEVDSTQATLDDATNTANQAQCAQQTAASNQAAAVSEEQAAQADSTAANNDLSAATDATNAASSEKQATASDLDCAVGKTKTAFNVKTQRDQDVKDKERAYKEAEAQKNKKKKNVIDYLCDAWNWVCEQCSKAWNALTNAKDKQKEAQEDYKNKKTDEDKKRVIDEEAQRELEKRQDEQDTAKSVADAAQVVLDAKTGAREVSDQELADALLDLADAMMAQEGAVTEHDGALDAFMEAQGYKADADGNLVDKQGNLVSCQEIVQGLETFVGELSTQKTTTEASYNQVLETTTAVIQGDEQKIQQLGTEIQTLQQDITQKKAELALQEEMLTQLTSERSDMNGYDTKEAEDKYWSDRQKLEQAIMSGDPKALEEAYKALYGDKEVVVDASGKVVDPATLSEEERAKCTTKKVSELGASDLTNKVAMDTVAAGESAQMAEMLADGAFAVNGQPVSQEELNEALIKQAEEQIAELERTMDAQGLFSKGVGGINNVLGIGTTGEDAKFEVQRYKELVEQLKTCKNPTQYAALYKQVTGNNFSAGEVVELCAYRQANNMPASPTTSKAPQVPAGNKIDLGEHVNSVVEACKGEDGKVNTNALRKTGNSKGAEAINDYKETQQNIVEGAKGVLVGLAAVAAVAASPFTGGGSLALLGAVAVGAAAGAGASIAIGMADSIYDADGNGSWDFNYTLDDLKGDAITGAITGGVSGLTMGVGDKVCGAVTSKASTAIATSGKEAFKQTVTKVGGKVFGEAVEGFIDGSVSAAADYTYRTAGTGEFSVTDMFKAAGQGGTMGAVVGGGMGGAGELFSGAKHLIDGKIMKGKVDDILTMGGMKEVIDLDDGTSVINYKANPNAGTDLIPTNGLAEIPDLKLEDVIANNLDPKYITDGKVNKWAINQITQDAKGAQKALQKAGLGENTLNVLNNISTDNYANVADVTALLTNKNNMAKLGLEGVDGKIDADKASNFLSGLDEVKTRANGSIEEITSYAPNGQKVSLQFDEKGSIADVKIVQDTPVDDGAKVASDVAPDVDSTSTTAAASDVNYKDDYVVMSDGDVIMPDGSVKSGADIESGPKADVEAGTNTGVGKNVDDIKVANEQPQTVSMNTTKANTVSRPELDKYVDPGNSAKKYPLPESAQEYVNQQALDYYNSEITRLLDLKNSGKIPADIDIEQIAMNNTNNYVEHMSFSMSRSDLFSDMRTGGFWAQYTPADQSHGPWKMHIFSANEADWQNMSDKLIPYLRDNDVDWKTFNSTHTPEMLGGVQNGKAFTIYPKNNADMAQIAKDLDYIIKNNGLEIKGSDIVGDNNLGDSGRLFYRYEFNSGAYKNDILDLADPDDLKTYHQRYDANRGAGKYLADDMTPEDDIWANFDPSNPNSMPKGVQVEPQRYAAVYMPASDVVPNGTVVKQADIEISTKTTVDTSPVVKNSDILLDNETKEKILAGFKTNLPENEYKIASQLLENDNVSMLLKQGKMYDYQLESILTFLPPAQSKFFKEIFDNDTATKFILNGNVEISSLHSTISTLSETQLENFTKIMSNDTMADMFTSGKISLEDINKFVQLDSETFAKNFKIASDAKVMSYIDDYQKYFIYGKDDIFEQLSNMDEAGMQKFQKAMDIIGNGNKDTGGYTFETDKLQLGGGVENVAKKSFVTPEGTKVDLEIRFGNDGVPRISRAEKYTDGSSLSWLSDGDKSTTTRYRYDTDAKMYDMESQIEVINNEFGEPIEVVHTKLSKDLDGAYETTRYTLSDYDENYDVLKAIEDGTIEGGNKTSFVTKNVDGSVTYVDSFDSNGTKTSRNYTQKLDNDGNIIASDYSYKITDSDGNVVLDTKRSYMKNPDGTTTTTVDGKKYTMSFNDSDLSITIKDELGNIEIFNAKDYAVIQAESIYKLVKNTPADTVLQLKNTDVKKLMTGGSFLNSNISPMTGDSGYQIFIGGGDIPTFSHEIGHAVDYSTILRENPEIIDIYNKEWAAFKASNTPETESIVQYFSPTSNAGDGMIGNFPRNDGGLGELIAETNMLLKGYGNADVISARAMLLTKYFPNTIAAVSKNIPTPKMKTPTDVMMDYVTKETASSDVARFSDVLRRRNYTPETLAKVLDGPVEMNDEILTRLEFPNIEKYKNVTLDTFGDLPLEDQMEFINQYISTLGGSPYVRVNGLPDIPLFKSLKDIDLSNTTADVIDAKRFEILDDLMEGVPRGKNNIPNTALELSPEAHLAVKPPLTNTVDNIETMNLTINGYDVRVGELPQDMSFYVHNMTQDNLTRLEALLLTDPDAVLCTGFKGGVGYLKGGDRMGVIVSPKTTKDLLVQAPQDASSGYGTTRNLYNIENSYLKPGNIDNEYVPNIIKGELGLSDAQYAQRMQNLIDNGAKYLEDVEKIDPELYRLIKKIPQDYSMFEGIMRPDIEAIYTPKDMEISERIARFAHDYDIPILRCDTTVQANTDDVVAAMNNKDKYYQKPKTETGFGFKMAGDL